MADSSEPSPAARDKQGGCPRLSSLFSHMCLWDPHPRIPYLGKLPWAVLLRLPAWAPHHSSRAASATVQSADTGTSIDAAEVGLPIGLVAWKSSQRDHRVLTGGRQEGTSRENQVCRVFWKNRRQKCSQSPAVGKSPTLIVSDGGREMTIQVPANTFSSKSSHHPFLL